MLVKKKHLLIGAVAETTMKASRQTLRAMLALSEMPVSAKIRWPNVAGSSCSVFAHDNVLYHA
jgi:hypothetical protein